MESTCGGVTSNAKVVHEQFETEGRACQEVRWDKLRCVGSRGALVEQLCHAFVFGREARLVAAHVIRRAAPSPRVDGSRAGQLGRAPKSCRRPLDNRPFADLERLQRQSIICAGLIRRTNDHSRQRRRKMRRTRRRRALTGRRHPAVCPFGACRPVVLVCSTSEAQTRTSAQLGLEHIGVRARRRRGRRCN